MRFVGLEPVQQAGERRDEGEADQEIAVRPAALERRDDERAQHGDADIGGNAARAGEDDEHQSPPPRLDETDERLDGRAPVHSLHPQDRVVGAAVAVRVMIDGLEIVRRSALKERHALAALLAALLRLRAHQPPDRKSVV